jgi:hypothetical protein
MKLFFLFFLIPCLIFSADQKSDVSREQRFPDVGKLHIDEAKLIYGQPTSTEKLHGGVEILRWSRTSTNTATDDWIANPYRRIPPGGYVDPTASFTMALTFDKDGILAARRFEGDFPGFGDYDAMFRKP